MRITFSNEADDAFYSAVHDMSREGNCIRGYLAAVTLTDGRKFDAELINQFTFAVAVDGEPTGETIVIDLNNGPWIEEVYVY